MYLCIRFLLYRPFPTPLSVRVQGNYLAPSVLAHLSNTHRHRNTGSMSQELKAQVPVELLLHSARALLPGVGLRRTERSCHYGDHSD